jgi:ferrous iron transport protein A
MSNVISLSDAKLGDRGVITRVGSVGGEHGAELERRLLELGFVEGARIQLLHQGVFGRDPMALKVDDMRVALRRHEARGLTVELFAEAAE